jgi:paraquat-inducible protein A
MCEHHHAAKHILCSQCDMLVALPRLEHGQKAACPRCGTTLTVAWDAPRQRPTAYALAALFMLLLSNLFPFVNMNVAGVTSEITLLEIPGVLFSEDYPNAAVSHQFNETDQHTREENLRHSPGFELKKHPCQLLF